MRKILYLSCLLCSPAMAHSPGFGLDEGDAAILLSSFYLILVISIYLSIRIFRAIYLSIRKNHKDIENSWLSKNKIFSYANAGGVISLSCLICIPETLYDKSTAILLSSFYFILVILIYFSIRKNHKDIENSWLSKNKIFSYAMAGGVISLFCFLNSSAMSCYEKSTAIFLCLFFLILVTSIYFSIRIFRAIYLSIRKNHKDIENSWLSENKIFSYAMAGGVIIFIICNFGQFSIPILLFSIPILLIYLFVWVSRLLLRWARNHNANSNSEAKDE